MQQICADIARYGKTFAQHPFFTRLQDHLTVTDLQTLARSLTFFILAFQDMLRLTAEQMQDPGLRQIAMQHRREDAGHDQWFLQDLSTLGITTDVVWLFSDDHRVTRDTAWRILAEICHAASDVTRLTINMVLEEAFQVFISHDALFECAGLARPLAYFSRQHREVELHHHMHEDAAQAQLHAFVLTAPQRAQALLAMERTYAAITSMFDDIHRRLTAGHPQQHTALAVA